MEPRAILVAEELQGRMFYLAKLLDFFGVSWDRHSEDEILEGRHRPVTGRHCVLAEMQSAGRILMGWEPDRELPELLRTADSLFFFGADSSESTRALLQSVTQSPSAGCASLCGEEILCSVSGDRPDVCGPLSGMTVNSRTGGGQFAMTGIPADASVVPLISTQQGYIFLAANLLGISCYLASSAAAIDINHPLEKPYFDISDEFLAAAPFVMYLRHAFADVIFQPAEIGACVILDDPVLTRRYGFVDFSHVARASCEHNFTLSLAFIPWNWKRSKRGAVETFKKNAARLSVSVHGCDHSASEFGTGDAGSIGAKARLALSRMEGHRRRTGLPFDPIMVFPQGAFSSVAPGALQYSGFTAAVNTELSPIDRRFIAEPADAWNTAILRYGNFAIYTRRYTFHGRHNFAFDLLLGKPCLLATHHDDFRNGGRDLIEFVDRLNSLGISLTWRPLGEVIRRAYLHRFRPDGTEEIRMFGNEILVENQDAGPRFAAIEKTGCSGEDIEGVFAGDKKLPSRMDGERLRFDLKLEGHESVLVRIRYKEILGQTVLRHPLKRRIKLGLRRYLSELRDEAQARAPLVYSLAQQARTLTAKRRSAIN